MLSAISMRPNATGLPMFAGCTSKTAYHAMHAIAATRMTGVIACLCPGVSITTRYRRTNVPQLTRKLRKQMQAILQGMPRLFIVLDGPDASGTSTHSGLLAERLRANGHDVLLTAEPTGGPVGAQIREYLKNGEADPMELQKLFTSDRAWHVKNVIEPALKDEKIVVSDRYWYSTIVYAAAQGLDLTELKKLNEAFVKPDLVLFTLPPLVVSLTRMAKRSQKEIFEREELQRKIHEGYVRMAQEDPSITVIDTSGEKKIVAEQIWNAAKKHLSS